MGLNDEKKSENWLPEIIVKVKLTRKIGLKKSLFQASGFEILKPLKHPKPFTS